MSTSYQNCVRYLRDMSELFSSNKVARKCVNVNKHAKHDIQLYTYTQIRVIGTVR